MKVLVTGANGYIGTRLIPLLVEEGHDVVALVRSPERLSLPEKIQNQVQVIIGDLLNQETLQNIPKNIEAAYYLVHSMASTSKKFYDLEEQSIRHFLYALEKSNVKQIIYLSGLVNTDTPSPHFTSRLNVEKILIQSHFRTTILKASIIIGSGSASFEIIRDLVEKLPVMVAPKWVNNRCQPIAVHDVMYYLVSVLDNEKCYDQNFEIAGPEVISYRDMLLRFAKLRVLKRLIINVPVLTPKLSSYWLYFVTSTNFSLAQALIESLRCESICLNPTIQTIIPHKCIPFEEAVNRAFSRIEQNMVISSWKDAIGKSRLNPDLTQYIKIPTHGCVFEKVEIPFKGDPNKVIEKFFSIGGKNGWYFMNWAWSVRGFIDKLFGGIGLRRGRKDPKKLETGNALDFWRVLLADKKKGHLLLYAEMKVPGEAWLEFKITDKNQKVLYTQIATFRPKGVLGRLYWYLLYPIHHLIFWGMAQKIIK